MRRAWRGRRHVAATSRLLLLPQLLQLLPPLPLCSGQHLGRNRGASQHTSRRRARPAAGASHASHSSSLGLVCCSSACCVRLVLQRLLLLR
jgi:hypothetical protein